MTYTFYINESRDLSINQNGKLQTVSGPEEVKQRIIIALSHYYQEYFMNVPGGVPWYEVILGSKDKKTAELIIRGKILEVPGVIGIVSLSLTFDNSTRKMTIYSEVEVQGNTTVIIETGEGE